MMELKPCPACGKPVALEGGKSWHDQYRFLIKCYECGCSRVADTEKDECVRRWNALPRPLRWTKEPPTEPGYYWYEEDHENQPVYVFRGAPLHGKTTLYAQFFGEGDVVHKVSEMSGKWAGPIQEPVN